MKIGIIGAGNIGGTLAKLLVDAGHSVRLANSRGPDSLAKIATKTGAETAAVGDVAHGADLIILTIPQNAVPHLPATLFSAISAEVPVVETGNYYPELRDGPIPALEDGMIESRWVERYLGRPVIKAFNNIYAASLAERPRPSGDPERIALSVYGDSSAARALVLRLVDEIGFDPVDGGPLDESWRQQPGMPAYCRDLKASELKEALKQASRERLSEARKIQEALTREYLGL